jgi:hypothetical protein
MGQHPDQNFYSNMGDFALKSLQLASLFNFLPFLDVYSYKSICGLILKIVDILLGVLPRETFYL